MVSRERDFQRPEVGRTIKDDLLLEWRPVAIVPAEVAWTWVSQFPEAVITRQGLTVSQTTLGKWEKGLGVVVGEIPTGLGGTELNLLHRNKKGEYVLWLSKEEGWAAMMVEEE